MVIVLHIALGAISCPNPENGFHQKLLPFLASAIPSNSESWSTPKAEQPGRKNKQKTDTITSREKKIGLIVLDSTNTY